MPLKSKDNVSPDGGKDALRRRFVIFQTRLEEALTKSTYADW